ncbi:uncharacterized protein LOC113305922 [Papaver somniferum]|uniref:uncharacterized protein LOC113305922 n=1 Tax=Papaver somniferum TaxID=3469 RepID=UPI000E701459|nr:uncharacterized protein LOC113305922 [Papaver somniferum]
MATPMPTTGKLQSNPGEKSVDQKLYRSMIGSLLYLTATSGTVDYGLSYSMDTNNSLVAYSDADWSVCVEDRKSTSGGCFYVGQNLVAWHIKKHNSQSLSTCEAEYVAASTFFTQLLWMK